MLYKSLATPGYLVLGEVETLTGNLREKLECLDSKAKIFKKNSVTPSDNTEVSDGRKS